MVKRIAAALALLAGVAVAPLIATAPAHADGWCSPNSSYGGTDCTYDGPHGRLCHHNTVCWSRGGTCQVYDYCS
jgi:hypothetical protein